MIDQLALALTTVLQQSTIEKRQDEIVIVAKNQPTPTIIDFNKFFEKFINSDSLITYISTPIAREEEDDFFVSPIKRSINITTPIIVGGRVTQPPIDEEDIVYFDE